MSRIPQQFQACPPQLTRRTHQVARRRRGFTLLESAMATAIIGLAFTAMLQLLATGTVANRESTNLTTAINLANNIHEASLRIPYEELEAELQGEHNTVSKCPVDALLNDLPDMKGWTQVVDVSYVDEHRLTLTVPSEMPTSRITVTVRRHGNDVYRTSWIASASN